MSGYAQVPESDSESVHELSSVRDKDDGHQEACPCHGLRKQKTWFLNRERLLVVYMLSLGIILLFLNLFLSTSLYLRSREPREQGDIQRGSSSIPSFDVVRTADQDCARRLSSYTPAIEAIEYNEMDFDFDFGKTSKYRGPPTENRENAWLELFPLGHHEGIMMETWAMPILNRTNLETYEKVKPGNGDGYIAWMEVHHQLECLNIVRQYTWLLMGSYPEDQIPKELRASPETNRVHVDYCIESLRLSLMCHGDMTPLLVTKDREEQSGWRADLNTHHKCRNFTKLQEWVKAHVVEPWEADE